MILKQSINYITAIFCILFLLLFSSQPYTSYISGFNYPTDEFFNFNSEFVNGSVFEWKIQNVEKSGNLEEIQINNKDILSIELLADFTECYVQGSYELLIYSLFYDSYGYPYRVFLNGEKLDWETQSKYLIYSRDFGPDYYQNIFGLVWPISPNQYQPVYFYPLDYVNGSETISYFDVFYNTLYEKAEQMEDVEVTKEKNDKFLEIKISQYENYTDWEMTSDRLLSINMEVGILGFYRINHNYVDKQNTSRSYQFSYEIISKKYGYRAYRAGFESLDFILISSLSVLCMLYFLRKKKKK